MTAHARHLSARAPVQQALVHLAFGVAGRALARSASGAYSYLLGGGAVYLVPWIYGLAVSHGSDAKFVPSTPPTTGRTSSWASR